MTAENFLNDKLKGCYQTYTEDGIILITGIEHSEMCEIMEEYKQLHIPVVVGQSEQLKPLPPNECERCGVLIDHRLNECGCCGL